MLHGKPKRDAAAQGIAEHVDLVVAERSHDRGHVVAHVDQADRPVAESRTAVSLKVDGDRLPSRVEDRQNRLKHLYRAEATVQKQQRLAFPADLVVIAHAVHFDVAGLGRCESGRRHGSYSL